MIGHKHIRAFAGTEPQRGRLSSAEQCTEGKAVNVIPIPVSIQAIDAPIIQEKAERSSNPAAAFSQTMNGERRIINRTMQEISGWSYLRVLEISEDIARGASVADRLPAYKRNIADFRRKTLPVLEANKGTARRIMRRIGASSGPFKGQVQSSVTGYCAAIDSTIASIDRMIAEAESLEARLRDCKGEGAVRKAASLYERAAKHVLGVETPVTYFSHGDGIDSIPTLEIRASHENYNDRSWRREIRNKIIDYVRETDEVSLGSIGVTFAESGETTRVA